MIREANVAGLMRMVYYSMTKNGRTIDHFNLNPDYFATFRRFETKQEKTLVIPRGGPQIPVRTYGWLEIDGRYFLPQETERGTMMITSMATIMK